MKKTQTKLERYSAGIDKALYRGAKRAELIAAATGTKVIVYEKGRIRRLTPRIDPSSSKFLRDIELDIAGRDQGYRFLQNIKLQRIKDASTSSQTVEKKKSVSDKRTRGGAR
jgi:hypothetical protein